MVAENLVLVAVFFLVLIVLSRLFTKMMRLLPGEVNSYRLMMIFPNLGFMGIPLVRSLYGEEAVIFVAFYIVGYNLLVYSYGILLAMGTRDDCEDAGKAAAKRAGLPWKKMLNSGMGACITVSYTHLDVYKRQATTFAVLLGGIVMLPYGVFHMFSHPLDGLMASGTGLILLGAGALCLALSVLFYGRFVPFVIRSIVNGLSRLLHRGR